uniref:Secretoglobin family 3A member 1 n=1 Tax=Pan paniscus TaxID=9597 RepID=A0A2R9B0C0_PANPA
MSRKVEGGYFEDKGSLEAGARGRWSGQDPKRCWGPTDDGLPLLLASAASVFPAAQKAPTRTPIARHCHGLGSEAGTTEPGTAPPPPLPWREGTSPLTRAQPCSGAPVGVQTAKPSVSWRGRLPRPACVPGARTWQASAREGGGGRGAGQGATVPGRLPRGRVLDLPSGDPGAQAVTPPCSLAAAAFLVGSAKHVAQPVAALESAAEAGAGTLDNPLGTLNPLKLLLSSLGIPVNHLIEGSQKCVAELGPEAVGAVKALKALLGALTMFG